MLTKWESSSSVLLHETRHLRRKEKRARSDPVAMGVSYNYASSVLLCAEDNNSILDLDDGDDDLGINGRFLGSGIGKIYDQKTGFFMDSLMVFPLQTEECLFALLEKESELLPARDYAEKLRSGALDMCVRKDAVDWIRKVHAYYSFGPVSAYLSVNYLDRFLCGYELPQGKAWMTQLLAVACLSLAAKMEETEVPLSLDLQIGNAKYVFEAKTIQRMELLVLSTLKWRMKSVTPFSFLDYFIHIFNDGNSPKELEIHRCVELILCTVKGIRFLEFRPSEVAAAVSLTAFSDVETVCLGNALNCCPYVQKAHLNELSMAWFVCPLKL
ncbi:cyclin-D4-1-like isoform X2 [Phalaenopsis equestris]|uniref:cyclin-D4-1-like isoform X2 n=1 Tax=Phalaenopsis equestris TaxID=78828 RepID=UPI0009E370D1|nr:cyclin-D4-1-like isoform X2 [Phalaenopsis equestris]